MYFLGDLDRWVLFLTSECQWFKTTCGVFLLITSHVLGFRWTLLSQPKRRNCPVAQWEKRVFFTSCITVVSAPSSFPASVLSCTPCGGSKLVGTSTWSDCVFVTHPWQPIHPGVLFPTSARSNLGFKILLKGFFPTEDIQQSSGGGTVVFLRWRRALLGMLVLVLLTCPFLSHSSV